MNEHTSLELSKRLFDKGFRGEHKGDWYRTNYKGYVVSNMDETPSYTHICPTWTLTEIWHTLNEEQRFDLLLQLAIEEDLKRNDLAELAGEWLIDNGHVEVTG